MSFRKFVHDNLVAIILIPTIIAIHWGVDRIQQYEKFVPPADRRDLPIVMAYKNLKQKVLDPESGSIEEDKEKGP